MTVEEALRIAIQHHQSGRLAEAEALYRQILAVAPQHADALHLLGVIAHQVGRSDLAIGMIAQAIAFAPGTAAYHSNLGEALRKMGRLDEAVVSYRRALQIRPDFADALGNLGLALAKMGRLDEAIASLRRAVLLQPDSPEGHNNLGGALSEAGRTDEAMACFQRAIALKPGNPEACYNLGNVLRSQGRLEEAMAAYRRAVEGRADYPEAHYNLGVALYDSGLPGESIAAYRDAIRLHPGYLDAHINLGNVLLKSRRTAEAIDAYRSALRVKPDHAAAHYNLANAMAELGSFPEAIAGYREALRCQPSFAEALNNLGGILMKMARRSEAEVAFLAALRLQPDYAEAQNNLAALLSDEGRLEAALAACRRAVELRPDFAEAWSNLGGILKDRGCVAESIAADRRALEIMPDFPKARSNLILDLHYVPGADATELFDEHCRWDELHAREFTRAAAPHGNSRAPERLLRIGYVSPDFREHSVAFFIEGLLENHDPAQAEVSCYSDSPRADAFTGRIRRCVAHWRETHGMPDAEVAELIRRDGIDILVDLAGHTADNRLLVFARKTAPVQVTYLGYSDTTGMKAMDFRFTDAHADPPGTTEHLHTEKLVRLPETFACFRPAENAPAASALPALTRGKVTFGSFHTLAKLNDPLLELWAEILKRVADSRLRMVSAGLDEASTRERIAEFFTGRGIDAQRVEFRGKQALADYFAMHSEVDVLLDSHPFSGHTVSCHALWMGVPVVTLAGTTHCARMVTSVLRNLGRPEWIAATPEEYVSIATQLASDLPKLAEIRAGLPAQMAASPLTDGARFARNVEQAYREMWRAWCARAAEKGTP